MAGEGGVPAETVSGFKKAVREAHLVAAWVFVGAILIQVFLAGLSLFWQGSFWSTHRDFGYSIIFAPLAMLILAALGRLPRRTIIFDALLLLLYLVQTSLPVLRTPLPGVAALHPVVALLMFGLATMAGIRARGFVPRPLRTA